MCIGIIALTNAIKNSRALQSVDLLGNNIRVEQVQGLANILKGHQVVRTEE
jgi:hypothetical protein